jgi:putative phage-type endonuclease
MKIDLKQNTPEWLEARKQYRTASEAAIVCGVSPFTTVEKFKLIKAGLKKQYYSKAMQQGHELEDKVRQWASDRFDTELEEACFVRGKYMASLDAYCPTVCIEGAPDIGVVVEIKVSRHTYDALKAGEVPEYYWLQIQQQLYCSQQEFGYLVAYNPKLDDYAISEPIHYEPSAIERIEKAWEAFDGMPMPEIADCSDNGAVMALFGEYAALKQEADHIKSKMDEIKAALIEQSNGLSLEADGYKLTRGKPRVTYDYRKACKDSGVDLEQYKKEGEPSWTLTVPKNQFGVIDQ